MKNRKHVRTSSEYSNRTRYAIYNAIADGKTCKYIARRFNVSQQSAAAFKFNFVRAMNAAKF
jgi:DNA-binding NarL/FixJ family response regulator